MEQFMLHVAFGVFVVLLLCLAVLCIAGTVVLVANLF